MRQFFPFKILLSLYLYPLILIAHPPGNQKLKPFYTIEHTIERTYSSLDPLSLRELLIYATLHEADNTLAQKQLQKLLNVERVPTKSILAPFLRSPLPSLKTTSPFPKIPVKELDIAQELLSTSEVECIDLLARGVLIKAGKNPSQKRLVEVLNSLLFYELKYQFPSHKDSERAIDRYSLLSSVLQLRRGVCLGISTLYLAIGQRIGLKLEIFTPPGHIFIAWRDDTGSLHPIETTCRGVYVPMETYMGVHLQTLNPRTLREVIGLSFFNQAAVQLHKKEWNAAQKLYETALLTLENDPLTLTLLEATKRLQGQITPHRHVDKDDLLSFDLANGYINQAGLEIALSPLDENPKLQIEALQTALSNNKKSLFLHQQLAALCIELQKFQQATTLLENLKLHVPEHLPTHYYLCALYFMREQDQKASDSARELLSLLSKKKLFLAEPILDLFQAIDARCGTSLTRDAYEQSSPLRFGMDSKQATSHSTTPTLSSNTIR